MIEIQVEEILDVSYIDPGSNARNANKVSCITVRAVQSTCGINMNIEMGRPTGTTLNY